MTTPTDYPLFVHHALELTSEITSRLEEISCTIDNVIVELHPGDETDADASSLMDTYDIMCGAVSDFADELNEYAGCDECCCSETPEENDLTDCVAKILEGQRLGYLSLPESLIVEMEEALGVKSPMGC